MALNNDWILKDKNGRLVYDVNYPEGYLVDVGNTQYQRWVANWVYGNMTQYGYDGIFADCSLSAYASELFWSSSANPINPRTGTFWKDEEVRQALIQIHKEIKNAIGSKLLICNGIYEGQRFYQRYNEYLEFLLNSSFDGIESEGLWYQYHGLWYTEEEWLDSLRLLFFMQDNFLKGKPERIYYFDCKLDGYSAPYQLPPNCNKEQMAKYAFASTLLGIKNSQNYLNFNAADMNYTAKVLQPLFNVDIGVPENEYYVIANTHVYARAFSNVKVLVNPTSDSYVVDLQGEFKTLDGKIVSKITIDNHTGIVLLRIL
jgi:hypothetical protein